MDEVVNEEMSYSTFNSDTAFLMRHAAQSDQVHPLPRALGEGVPFMDMTAGSRSALAQSITFSRVWQCCQSQKVDTWRWHAEWPLRGGG